MKIPFSVAVALRYLRPKRSFVIVITILSIVGVMLGVGVPFTVMSIMNGFERNIHQMFLDFEPHIMVSPDPFFKGEDVEERTGWTTVEEQLKGASEIEAVSPFIEGQILAQFNDEPSAPYLRAFFDNDPVELARLERWLISGKVDLGGDNILLSQSVADRVGARIGDKITVYSPGNIKRVLKEQKDSSKRGDEEDGEEEEDGITELDLGLDLKVVAVIQSLYNVEYVVVPIHVGRELFGEDDIHGLGLTISDPLSAGPIRDRLLPTLPPGWFASTWMEKNATRFEAVRLERLLISSLLCFILIVGFFCIIITILTVTMQKRPEIGLMKAIGAKTRQIMAVFLIQGLVVGLIGTIAGFVLGGLVIRYRNVLRYLLEKVFKIPVLPQDIYGITELPAAIDGWQIVFLAICSMVLCLLGAALPAFFVARMDAARALRNT